MNDFSYRWWSKAKGFHSGMIRSELVVADYNEFIMKTILYSCTSTLPKLLVIPEFR